jgi:hypothetical protein
MSLLVSLLVYPNQWKLTTTKISTTEIEQDSRYVWSLNECQEISLDARAYHLINGEIIAYHLSPVNAMHDLQSLVQTQLKLVY